MEQNPNKDQNVGKLAKLLAQKEAEEAKLRDLENTSPKKQHEIIINTKILNGEGKTDLADSMEVFELDTGEVVLGGTDKGINYGDHNEDRVAISPDNNRITIVDGMGGMGRKGEGELAAQILSENFLKYPEDIDTAVEKAIEEMQENPEITKGGALFATAKLREESTGKFLYVAQAGDCRVMVIKKDGSVRFESKDESLVQTMVEAKHITPDEGLIHHMRNSVNNAVSTEAFEGLKTYPPIKVEGGDLVLLMSDGISDNFTAEEISKMQKDGNLSPQELFKKISEESGKRMQNKKEIIEKSTRVANSSKKEEQVYIDGYRSTPKADNRGLIIMQVKESGAKEVETKDTPVEKVADATFASISPESSEADKAELREAREKVLNASKPKEVKDEAGEKFIFCPHCGKKQNANAVFCAFCGKQIPKMEDVLLKTQEEHMDVCPKCGNSQKSKEGFCGNCGAPMVSPKNPEQTELVVALGEARMKYVTAYKEFKKDRKKGFIGKIKQAKEFIFGGTVKEKNIPPELKKLEEEYDNAAAALGKQMYGEKINELKVDSTLTNEQKTAELLRYKQNEIFNKVIVQEQTMLAALKTENLPPKERGIAKKALGWYISQPTWKKVAMATVFSAAFFALVAPGSVAAAGGMGAFVGIRAARGVAGSFLSQTAVKSYDWLFKDKSAEKRIEAEAELSKLCGYTNADEIAEGKKRYAKIAEQEQKTKRRRAVKKVVIGGVAGGFASMGVGYGAGKILSSSIDAQTGGNLKPDNSATPDTNGNKPPEGAQSPKVSDGGKTEGAKSVPKIEKPVDAAIVQKGQGVEHAFIKQIEANPELAKELGFKGGDAKALHIFAQNQAHEIALKTGYVYNTGNEIRVMKAGEVAYEIKMDGKNITVDEKTLDGKIIETHNQGDKFGNQNDYEYKKGKTVETVRRPKVTAEEYPKVKKSIRTGATEIENIKIPKGSNTIDLSDSKPGDKTFVKPGDKLPADQTELKTETTIKEQAPATVTDTPATDAKPVTTPKPSPTPEEISKEIKTQIELTEKYPQFKGTTFAKNTLNIPEEKLVETYKVYEENIKQITKGNSVENFRSKVGGSSANNYIDAKSVEGDLVTPYVNEIAKLANEKPKFDLKNGHETLQNFIERCVLKLTKEGKLEEIKNLKIK